MALLARYIRRAKALRFCGGRLDAWSRHFENHGQISVRWLEGMCLTASTRRLTQKA